MSIVDYISVILSSLFTSIVFISFILYSDRKSREPLYMILLALSSCIVSVCLVMLIDKIILPRLEILTGVLYDYYSFQSIFKTLILALIEEYSKLMVLYIFISRNSNFDDIYDGIVYSVLISLSFAALESILFAFKETSVIQMQTIGILRGVTAVPLHLVVGIIMGYFMGLEKFTWGTKKRAFYLICCLIVPTFIHFSYNFCLSNIFSKSLTNMEFIIMIIVFFIPFFIFGYLSIKRAIYLNKKFINNEKYENLMTKNEYDEIINNKY